MADRDDNFLGRWSRRKVEARHGLKKRSEPADGADSATSRDSAALSDEMRPDVAGESGSTDHVPDGEAPDLAAKYEDFDFDALDYDSDYTQFMQKGVPDAVRRRALRALWQSNPILANVDGLNDYDEDFTDAALVVDALKSAYRVGKGYRTDEEIEAEALEDEAEAGPETDVEIARQEAPADTDAETESDAEAGEPERRGSDETA